MNYYEREYEKKEVYKKQLSIYTNYNIFVGPSFWPCGKRLIQQLILKPRSRV